MEENDVYSTKRMVLHWFASCTRDLIQFCLWKLTKARSQVRKTSRDLKKKFACCAIFFTNHYFFLISDPDVLHINFSLLLYIHFYSSYAFLSSTYNISFSLFFICYNALMRFKCIPSLNFIPEYMLFFVNVLAVKITPLIFGI